MSFSLSYESSSPRASYRLTHQGLRLLIRGSSTLHEIMNMSSTGLAFRGVFKNLKKGDTVYFTIIFEGRTLLSQIKAKVMHVDIAKGFTGCEYLDLPAAQLKKIEVFILQIQKLEIKKQQAQRDAEK